MLASALNLEEDDRRLRAIVATIPPDARRVLLEVLTATDEQRAEAIGKLYGAGVTPETTELLMDAEQEPALRAVLVGMLREG